MNKIVGLLLLYFCFVYQNVSAQTIDESSGNIIGFNRIITGSNDWMDIQISGSSGSFKIHDKTNGSNWVRWDSGSNYTEFLKDVQMNKSLYVDRGLDVGNDRNSGSSSDGLNVAKTNNTNIQFTHDTWSASHAILFNAYRSATDVTGNLTTLGDTKYANDAGSYNGGAGSIMYFGNYGIMDFFVSPVSTGQDTNVDWGTPKMRIRRNGNVGINTTDPTEKLTVNGTTKTEEVIVEENIGADFVFDNSYDLPSLSSIEKFIKANNHLSGIPSADEMKNNGIKVGDLQIKLLQKIEEMTLYMIEQDKLNRRQQQLIKQQEEAINQLQQKIQNR